MKATMVISLALALGIGHAPDAGTAGKRYVLPLPTPHCRVVLRGTGAATAPLRPVLSPRLRVVCGARSRGALMTKEANR
jgi:hypothetical protein